MIWMSPSKAWSCASRITRRQRTGGFLAQFTDDARILRLVSDKVLRKLDLEPTDLFRGLQSLLQTPDQALETTAACSQETLLDAVRQMEETADATNNANQQIKRCLDAAKPVIQDCGGRQRLLIMAPASLKRGAIRKGVRESLGVTPSVICTGVDFVACYELEKVSLPESPPNWSTADKTLSIAPCECIHARISTGKTRSFSKMLLAEG